VRGHEGHPQNEYANDLAVRAAREQTNSDGIVASRFDEWLATEREKKRVSIEPQAFPAAERFRAVRAYPVVRPPVMEP
jgi:ribonuclease HI